VLDNPPPADAVASFDMTPVITHHSRCRVATRCGRLVNTLHPVEAVTDQLHHVNCGPCQQSLGVWRNADIPTSREEEQ
jgi:hypothetical protein